MDGLHALAVQLGDDSLHVEDDFSDVLLHSGDGGKLMLAIIGIIPVDSIYTPVRKVNYTVENTRVGDAGDGGKLMLDPGDLDRSHCGTRQRGQQNPPQGVAQGGAVPSLQRLYHVLAIGTQSIIGVIPVDSICTPVRKVNYSVENTRVGDATDYDKLTLELSWKSGPPPY